MGRGVIFGKGDIPAAPYEFWGKVFEEFRDLEITSISARYEDPDEAAEEPVWEGRRTARPEVENQETWDGELGLRQVKDWINRGTGRPWSTGSWMRWIRRGGGQ